MTNLGHQIFKKRQEAYWKKRYQEVDSPQRVALIRELKRKGWSTQKIKTLRA